jgi:L-lactate dehydrogenase complex protein LldF
VHIVIAGIEKILPQMADLGLMWPLLATFGTGQKVTVYNSIISGPRKPGETDGPEEMYVILLDNGRTNLLRNEVRESLYCIRCGSCLNACPVYKNIGGHAYGTTYTGPIGEVITPHMQKFADQKHLSYASSLCGNCTDVCPIKINIHGMLLENRHLATKQKLNGMVEDNTWRLWQMAMQHRFLLDAAPAKTKNKVVNRLFKDTWVHDRGELNFSKKSFSQLWRERNQ